MVNRLSESISSQILFVHRQIPGDYWGTMVNQDAYEIGQLTTRMVDGYFAHSTAIIVARDPRSKQLIPEKLPENQVMVGFVGRKDGTQIAYHFEHYLNLGASDPSLGDGFARVWLTGSLLTLGDALTRNSYFDHAPELKLVAPPPKWNRPWESLSN